MVIELCGVDDRGPKFHEVDSAILICGTITNNSRKTNSDTTRQDDEKMQPVSKVKLLLATSGGRFKHGGIW
jgi:hypothetical protein